MQSSGYRDVAIIGDGGMGSVLSILLCEKGIHTRMWGHDAGQLAEIEHRRENGRFLPGYRLPDSLVFEPRDDRATADAELIVSAVPCQFMRGTWKRLARWVPEGVPVVSVAKGIENDTLLRPTQILGDVLGKARSLAALSGPTIADELARRLPATACVATEDQTLARKVQYTLTCPWLRVYTNTDLIGVELAGAMKNVIAIAAGIIDGVGAGDNAKAALLARGLAEITRLGLAMGACEPTFAGLTGLGDLVTTCISPTGRNRSFGERIGRGRTMDEALHATESVVEGVATCKSVMALAVRHGVEMPITQAVYAVLFEGQRVRTAIEHLMSRRLKPECGDNAP
ncbi:MAG: NAD(P)-dependent glycerol-3-phosphate dehydrogenase [Planctomycetes bacterium]|jgi:glycerol-3-phosphate dehydrogenase (NAD(P)+)|nr:NAD(P)-dependent glycerol-3-phosphate dehydrogenase [Planctomycetota bacterium]